ncbi:MAG TPA: hypothetical protein VGO93_25915 [Candidatus Xenobia bacterium]
MPTRIKTPRIERVRAFAAKHWLGVGLPDDKQAAVEEIRRQYLLTAQEYSKAARGLYDALGVQPQRLAAQKSPFMLGNRNVQLFLAFSILWEAFNHIYTAAANTAFSRGAVERAPLESERDQIGRVLSPPILDDEALQSIGMLKNGEMPGVAVRRLMGRSSRELRDLYGVTYEASLTDLNAFLQGRVSVTDSKEVESWIVLPRDDDGKPVDPDSPFNAAKYRSVVKWDCSQIRTNLNFLGKGDGSIDDAILIIRAFCLVAPIVDLLLDQSRRGLIFALA